MPSSPIIFANAIFCLAFGWPANLLLLWLILYRSNQKLRVWGFVLLQNIFIDLVLLLFYFLVQPIGMSDGKILHGAMAGPLGDWLANNHVIKYIVYISFFFWFDFAKYAVVVPFIHRWFVICCEKQLSQIHYLLLLSIPFGMALIDITLTIAEYILECPDYMAHSDGCYQGDYFMQFRQDTQFGPIVGMISVLFNIATYLAIAFICLSIWLKARHCLAIRQKRSQEVHRQMNFVLLVQAAIPLCFSYLPTTILAFSISTGANLPEFSSILYFLNWSALSCPFVTILVVGHYRRCVLGIFHWRKVQNVVTSVAHLQKIKPPNSLPINQIRQI